MAYATLRWPTASPAAPSAVPRRSRAPSGRHAGAAEVPCSGSVAVTARVFSSVRRTGSSASSRRSMVDAISGQGGHMHVCGGTGDLSGFLCAELKADRGRGGAVVTRRLVADDQSAFAIVPVRRRRGRSGAPRTTRARRRSRPADGGECRFREFPDRCGGPDPGSVSSGRPGLARDHRRSNPGRALGAVRRCPCRLV
jgi:hypothetical protein